MASKINIHRGFLGLLLLIPAIAFSQSGSDRVRMLITTLEKDPDYKVRIAASQALSKIADGTVADWMIRAFRKDQNDAVRLSILYAISEIPDQRILPPLIELANQEVLSPKERVVTEQILWNFKEVFHTSSWIAEALNSNDIQMKRISIWILGIIGDGNLVPVFEKFAQSPEEEIQVQSFESLSKIGSIEAQEFCKREQQDQLAPQVARAAKYCEQMNTLLLSKKMTSERSFKKKNDR